MKSVADTLDCIMFEGDPDPNPIEEPLYSRSLEEISGIVFGDIFMIKVHPYDED